MTEKDNSNYYQEFNNFQTAFYTNIAKFEDYSNFDFKRHGYILINNLAKGFPNLASLIINLKGFNFDGTSPAILKALQRNFVNNFNSARIPNFIYFKGTKDEKEKNKAKETSKGLIFSIDIQSQIQSILFIDSKTYEYLKFTDKVQNLGKQILGEFVQKEKVKATRKKK